MKAAAGIKNNKSKVRATPEDEIKAWKHDKYYLFSALFVISVLYFCFIGNYIFFYQENQMLFVFSCDYLEQFAVKPGGILVYAGNFLSQGYFSNLYGAFILTLVFILNAIIFLEISKKLSADRTFSLLFAALAACLLILMQANINYLMHNNLGVVAAGLYFLTSITSKKTIRRISVMAFFPLFFWLAGAYAWVYLGMYMFYNIFRKDFIFPVCLLIIGGLTLLIFKGVIFLQPLSELLNYPVPPVDYFSKSLMLRIFIAFFILYPVLVKLPELIKKNERYLRPVSTWSMLVVLLVTIFLMSKNYNQDSADLFRLEKKFIARDWDGVIRQQENLRSRNPVAEYYYNTALAESGMLCDRLFFGPQDYGPGTLSIPWNSQISMNKLFRGAYFYYAAGLINEAHRWAFESMVTEGFHPENIKLLIKTDLINGHFRVAEKYIGVLNRTLHYRKWAGKYEAMLRDPELIKNDTELGEKIKLKPKDDFIIRIRNPRRNITSLMQSNPDNSRAFEYNLAWLMLEKDFNGIVSEMDRLNQMNYIKIPRHIEEAAVLLKADIGPSPALNLLAISNDTQTRFSKYISSIMSFDRTRSPEGTGIQKEFANTFWYYLDFKKLQK